MNVPPHSMIVRGPAPYTAQESLRAFAERYQGARVRRGPAACVVQRSRGYVQHEGNCICVVTVSTSRSMSMCSPYRSRSMPGECVSRRDIPLLNARNASRSLGMYAACPSQQQYCGTRPVLGHPICRGHGTLSGSTKGSPYLLPSAFMSSRTAFPRDTGEPPSVLCAGGLWGLEWARDVRRMTSASRDCELDHRTHVVILAAKRCQQILVSRSASNSGARMRVLLRTYLCFGQLLEPRGRDRIVE